MCLRCCDIVAELFGIVPGNDELARLISILFASDSSFSAIFACTVHLFHRTWREMQAKGGEMEKVASVVAEQLRHVLKMKEIQDVETFNNDLEAFSYKAMKRIWRKEQEGKENDQLNSLAVIQLSAKLRPNLEEVVRVNHLNYLKHGAVFQKLVKNKKAYWHWKLDASEKMLTITVCDSDKFMGKSEKEQETRQIWLKDIADVPKSVEDRKTSSSRSLPGLRIKMKDGEELMAVSSDESQAAIWREALSQLIGENKSNKHTNPKTESMVEQLLKMELRVRLLNVNVANNGEKPEIPPIPADISSIVQSF
uniref:ELMO domain-containing protein n=1 Tax=Caenorhabditis japonica TaxID=281687 RepID=A0A8R1DFK5_CAEJA